MQFLDGLFLIRCLAGPLVLAPTTNYKPALSLAAYSVSIIQLNSD